MRILVWHVHGSWLTSFLQGPHEYLLPVVPDRGPDGRGRARTWDWPVSAREVTPAELAHADVDLVVLQRPEELALAERWLGRRPGRDLPAVYVEHDAPTGPAATTRHPLADRADIPVVHVTAFNRLMWDCGRARTTVVDHGVVDPGALYSGEVPRAAVVSNEPVRRGRVVGADLLPDLAALAPVDLFGMGVASLDVPGVRTFEDVPQALMHAELARRRVYVHLTRWTSLGLSLIEAMHLGMPVVALATTAAAEAVPPGGGVVSARPEELREAVRDYLADPDLARAHGRVARRHALRHYGLDRFLADWEVVLEEALTDRPRSVPSR